MSEESIKQVAQDPSATPDALASLLGVSAAIDTLLAQHPKSADIEVIAGRMAAVGDPLGGLPAAYHRSKLARTLNEFAGRSGNPFVTQLVNQYLAATRPFCFPSCHVQELSELTHRRRDLIGGFPYTSEAFPWPTTEDSGLSMQPIVQIDLLNAGSLLGQNLGDQLLQVWGPVFASAKEASAALGRHGTSILKTRLIPRDQLSEAASEFLPTWSKLGSGQTRTDYLMEFSDDDLFATQHLLSWSAALPMFGSHQHVFELASSLCGEDGSPDDDELADIVDGLVDAAGNSPLVPGGTYLGGVGGGNGGEYDPSYCPNLLVRISDGNGFYFAVRCTTDGRRGPTFESSFSIRV